MIDPIIIAGLLVIAFLAGIATGWYAHVATLNLRVRDEDEEEREP